jgi:hypothetical protein
LLPFLRWGAAVEACCWAGTAQALQEHYSTYKHHVRLKGVTALTHVQSYRLNCIHQLHYMSRQQMYRKLSGGRNPGAYPVKCNWSLAVGSATGRLKFFLFKQACLLLMRRACNLFKQQPYSMACAARALKCQVSKALDGMILPHTQTQIRS